jgi:DNA repair protein RadD
MKLRDYQREAVDAVGRALRAGVRAPLVVAPTGSGKSAILGQICRDFAEMGARILVATHRKELIAQDERAILRIWPEGTGRVGVYSAGLNRREMRTVTVAGVQSVARRVRALGHVDVVIIDEAHLVSPKADTQYGKLLAGLRETNPDLCVIGLTATPYRLGQGLLTQGDGKIFESVAYTVDVKRLIANGYLSPLVSSKVSTKIDLDGVRTSGGDYVLADLELAADVDSITEAVARDIAETKRRHIIVFGVSVEHASRLRNAIQMQGISCETVVGETPNRDRILAEFKAGRLQCVTSCDVLTTGFDSQNVNCVAMVRATLSPSLYVQCLGRGMRVAEGKTDCIVLDYGGNIARHGPIDDVKVTAKQSRGEGKAPIKLCPSCHAEIPAGLRVCEFCDHEFPEPEKRVNWNASKLAVISEDSKPERFAVERREFNRHAKEGKIPSLRVSYFGPSSRSEWHPIASEWICVEHEMGNFARRKAESWWRQNCDAKIECPTTVSEALDLEEYLKPVTAIWTKPDGKYLRITGYEFGKAREPGEDDDDETIKEDETPTTEADIWEDEIPW